MLSQMLAAHEPTPNENSADVELTPIEIRTQRPRQAPSDGRRDATTLQVKTLSRPGEVLESVPGLIVTQHSGEGKANQYFLRGFNLDHGTDLAVSLEGIPLNQPTHAHGQGYLDLGFVIPELLGNLAFNKGPYRAAQGDFANSGSVQLQFAPRMPSSLKQTVGSYGYRRTLLSEQIGNAWAAFERVDYQGPWETSQNLGKNNLWLGYQQQDEQQSLRLNYNHYRNDWRATNQIPQRAIDSGLLNSYSSADPSDRGSSARDALAATWHRHQGAWQWQVQPYWQQSRLSLLSNFTYFMDNPTQGDQFMQSEERRTQGIHTQAEYWFDEQGTRRWLIGSQYRHDQLRDLTLGNSQQGALQSITRRDQIQLQQLGLFTEYQQTWLKRYQAALGWRVDQQRAQVINLENSAGLNLNGSQQARIGSPKLRLGWRVTGNHSLHYQYGQGFHSNDVRGVIGGFDKTTGQRTSPASALVKGRSQELGWRWQHKTQDFQLTYWTMDLDSELVFAGDSGSTEPSRATRRHGWELNIQSQLFYHWWLQANVDLAKAYYRADEGSGTAIPNSIPKSASMEWQYRSEQWRGSLCARYLGPRPLNENASLRSQSLLTWNLALERKLSPQLKLRADIINLTNRRGNDIEYAYASQLKNETAPVFDRHVHPLEPRMLRVSAELSW